jgi:hypothetical protein
VSRQQSLAIVGVGFPNGKGPSRRFEIELCVPGEPIELVPEPKNPVDPRAIGVISLRGVKLGYVRAEQAQYIGTAISRGGVSAIFQRSEPWGCTIRIAFDGSVPVLPPDNESAGNFAWPPPDPDDQPFYPDPEYPDD